MGVRVGPRIPQFAYLCRSPARGRLEGFRPPGDPPRNGDPMRAKRPYERFRALAFEGRGPGPVDDRARNRPVRGGAHRTTTPGAKRTPYDGPIALWRVSGAPSRRAQTDRRDPPRQSLPHAALAEPCGPSTGRARRPRPGQGQGRTRGMGRARQPRREIFRHANFPEGQGTAPRFGVCGAARRTGDSARRQLETTQRGVPLLRSRTGSKPTDQISVAPTTIATPPTALRSP